MAADEAVTAGAQAEADACAQAAAPLPTLRSVPRAKASLSNRASGMAPSAADAERCITESSTVVSAVQTLPSARDDRRASTISSAAAAAENW